jgi:hypothetical protein
LQLAAPPGGALAADAGKVPLAAGGGASHASSDGKVVVALPANGAAGADGALSSASR